MPRQKNENREKARLLYEHGDRTIRDIAEKLGIPITTVKSWKSRDKWNEPSKKPRLKKIASKTQKDAKKDSEGRNEKTQKRRGGGPPKGNMNGVGHGAPKGNKNAAKHGGYSLAALGVFDDDELELMDDPDPEEELIDQIKFYRIRERRIMKAINSLMSETDNEGKPLGIKGMYTDTTTQTVDTRVFASREDAEKYREEISNRIAKGDRLPGDKGQKQQTKSSVLNAVLRLEKELTSVQRAKTASIKELTEYQSNHGEKTNNEADDWADLIGDIESEEDDG